MILLNKYEWTSLCTEDGYIASGKIMTVLYVKGLIELPITVGDKWLLVAPDKLAT